MSSSMNSSSSSSTAATAAANNKKTTATTVFTEVDFGSGGHAPKVQTLLHASEIFDFDELVVRLNDSVESITRNPIYKSNGTAWSADTVYRAISCLESALEENIDISAAAARHKVDIGSVLERIKAEKTRFNSLRRNVTKAPESEDEKSPPAEKPRSSKTSTPPLLPPKKEEDVVDVIVKKRYKAKTNDNMTLFLPLGGGRGGNNAAEEAHPTTTPDVVAATETVSSAPESSVVDKDLRKAFNALKLDVEAIRKTIDMLLKV